MITAHSINCTNVPKYVVVNKLSRTLFFYDQTMNNNATLATPSGKKTDETAFTAPSITVDGISSDDDSDADNLNTTQHNGIISTDQQQQDDAKRQLPEGWERVKSGS